MGFQLNSAGLRKLCKELKLYTSAPELNDVLHLQCKGIVKLENLDEYTGLKTLYLEQNAISRIENLDMLVNLRCLYLGKNMIEEISGLNCLLQLNSLDLSDNYIMKIENLSCCTALQTLIMSGNKLRSAEDVSHLRSCTSITSLDLANNKIEDVAAFELVAALHPLSYLRLLGNPAVSMYKHYRKRMMVSLPTLNYLDESPCFPKDRRLAEAFVTGGLEAERAMREQIRAEEDLERERHRKAFDDMIERARTHPPEPHDPMRFRAVPPGESESDDEGLPPGYTTKKKKDTAKMVLQQHQEALADPPAPGLIEVEVGSCSTNNNNNNDDEVHDSLEDKLGVEPREELSSGGTPQERSLQSSQPVSDVKESSEAHNTEKAHSLQEANGHSSEGAQAADVPTHDHCSGSGGGLGGLMMSSEFQNELQERAIARAAARAEAALYAGTAMPDSHAGGLEGHDHVRGMQPHSNRAPSVRRTPQVWGTTNYRRLWEMAVEAGEQQELAMHSSIASQLDQEPAALQLPLQQASGQPLEGLLVYGTPQPQAVQVGSQAVQGSSLTFQVPAGTVVTPSGEVSAGNTHPLLTPEDDISSNRSLGALSLDDSVMAWQAPGNGNGGAAPGGSGGGGGGGAGSLLARHLVNSIVDSALSDTDLDSARARNDLAHVLPEIDLDSARDGIAEIDSARSSTSYNLSVENEGQHSSPNGRSSQQHEQHELLQGHSSSSALMGHDQQRLGGSEEGELHSEGVPLASHADNRERAPVAGDGDDHFRGPGASDTRGLGASDSSTTTSDSDSEGRSDLFERYTITSYGAGGSQPQESTNSTGSPAAQLLQILRRRVEDEEAHAPPRHLDSAFDTGAESHRHNDDDDDTGHSQFQLPPRLDSASEQGAGGHLGSMHSIAGRSPLGLSGVESESGPGPVLGPTNDVVVEAGSTSNATQAVTTGGSNSGPRLVTAIRSGSENVSGSIVMEPVRDLLQQARSLVGSSVGSLSGGSHQLGPSATSTSIVSNAGLLSSPRDPYYDLAETRHDTKHLAQARATVLGPTGKSATHVLCPGTRSSNQLHRVDSVREVQDAAADQQNRSLIDSGYEQTRLASDQSSGGGVGGGVSSGMLQVEGQSHAEDQSLESVVQFEELYEMD